MVKIYTSINSLEDNGAANMAQMLYKASTERWFGPYNFFKLDFREKEVFYDEEDYYIGYLELYYDKETLKKWQKDQYIQFPAAHIKKLSYYPEIFNEKYCPTECTCIEIESDNDKAIKAIFTFLSAFGDGEHSFGGTIKINNVTDEHIGTFRYDGCDRIYGIEIIN